jgi:hypothetical protein
VDVFPHLVPLPPSDREELPSSPPSEVLDAMSAADAAYEHLHDSGRELHFRVARRGGVVVELRDLEQHELTVLMPSQALTIAAEPDKIDGD